MADVAGIGNVGATPMLALAENNEKKVQDAIETLRQKKGTQAPSFSKLPIPGTADPNRPKPPKSKRKADSAAATTTDPNACVGSKRRRTT